MAVQRAFTNEEKKEDLFNWFQQVPYGDPLYSVLQSRSRPFWVGAGAAPSETAPKGWLRIRP